MLAIHWVRYSSQLTPVVVWAAYFTNVWSHFTVDDVGAYLMSRPQSLKCFLPELCSVACTLAMLLQEVLWRGWSSFPHNTFPCSDLTSVQLSAAALPISTALVSPRLHFQHCIFLHWSSCPKVIRKGDRIGGCLGNQLGKRQSCQGKSIYCIQSDSYLTTVWIKLTAWKHHCNFLKKATWGWFGETDKWLQNSPFVWCFLFFEGRIDEYDIMQMASFLMFESAVSL